MKRGDPNRIAELEIETQGRVLTVDLDQLSPEMRRAAEIAEMLNDLGMEE